MQEITAYRCADGSIHADEDKAKAHEDDLLGQELDELRDQVSDLETKTSNREDDLSEQVDQLEAELEDMRQTLLQCLPFFEDWKDENGVCKPRTMVFMIRKIKQSLGETK